MDLRTWTVPRASKETGLSQASLRRLLESGAIAGNRERRTWHISVASLEAWITRTAPPPPPVQNGRAFPEVEDHFA